MTRYRAVRAALVLGLILATTLAACASSDLAVSAAGPESSARDASFVTSLQQRDRYLIAHIAGGRANLRLIFPSTDDCVAVLGSEAAVEYRRTGSFGRVVRGAGSCDPIGIASLAAWRDRRPRGASNRATGIPRKTAVFHVVHEDSEVVMVRGKFLLANRIGIGAAHDLVAVLPNQPICRRPIERGVASLEFRDNGPVPFALVSDRGLCPVLGFAIPRF